jgi:septal ring factor EnvC (AmiA/AmiB activator)
VPESIRNAIVIAFIAVLVAMVGVGLLLWRGRPAAPAARADRGLPLLVTDRNGGIYDLNVKLQQMERRLGASQVVDQRLMEELRTANQERDRLAGRFATLEKEVRSLRKRVLETEQRAAKATPPVQPITPATTTTPPATTSAPTGEMPPAPPP